MSMETERTDITIETKGAFRTIQVMADGDAIVPDIKPDIEKILTVSGRINTIDEKISDNRAFFKGEVVCSIMYRGRNTENCIYSMIATIPFEDVIPLPESEKNSNTHIYFNIENINYKVINDRKINLRCAITAKSETNFFDNMSIIKTVSGSPDIMVKDKSIKICKCVDRKKDILNINEILNLPSGKPNIGNIVECTGYIGNREIKPFNGKVNITGTIFMTVIYTSDTENSMAETAFFEVPFNIMEDCRNSSENITIDTVMDISDINCKTEIDDDGEERKINTDISIDLYMQAYENEEKDIADDIYSLSENLKPEKTNIEYPCFVMKNSTKASFKDIISADNKYPEMLRVQNVSSKMDITDKKPSENKITVEGVLSGDILYTAQSDSEPVSVIPYNIPFSQDIEIKSDFDDMFYNINGYIDNISFDMMSERETEVKVTCIFDVTVFRNMRTDFLTDITTDENCKNISNAEIIIYTVQRGDSLWDIAKKYSTTMEDITMLNTIENPEKLVAGEKLLIFKTVPKKNIEI